MPLLDHFHGPLARRAWQSFHAQWAGAMAADLNRRLPKRFVAEAPMSLGSSVSADVVEYEGPSTGDQDAGGTSGQGGGSTALATETYTPPEADLTMAADFDTEVKVEVRDVTDDYRVLAVLELVSPGNKKEQGERERFASKYLSYLGKGIGLVIVDIVSECRWNLHNELVHLAERGPRVLMEGDPPLYVTAYRPVHRKRKDMIDIWTWPLSLGAALPAVPLALKGFGCVRLDLEATYSEACERSRIP